MTDKFYLKRLFQAYYKEIRSNIPIVNSFEFREFGFIPWDKYIMIRHLSFRNPDNLVKELIQSGPRHVYSSGSLYLEPDNSDMKKKQYQGCDLIMDIDVDHFYTSCKEDHDQWYCKECGKTGKGMPNKCPKCKSMKFKSLNWICDKCLTIAKKEIIKLIYDFLIPDFGIKETDLKIAFSGHRGYHLKVENERIRTLSSEARRELVDYFTGENISFEILGLREIGHSIYGLLKGNIGWSQKIMKKIEELLIKPDNELEDLLLDKRKFNLNPKLVNSFLNSKDEYLELISKGHKSVWAIEGFTLNRWINFLKVIVSEIGAEIDEPVTIDIHRLIRYPGSLHGATGFKVQEIGLNELQNFNPLNENDENLDPIVFESKNTQKIEIIDPFIPPTVIKGEKYGPFNQGEKIEVPHHIAVFLLCKGVAQTV
jgi:DNA primase small subunit